MFYEAHVSARTSLLDVIVVIYSICVDQTLLEINGRTLSQACSNVGVSVYQIS